MRLFYLLISLTFILLLTACGEERVMTPPDFSNISASGSLGSTTILTAPSQDSPVVISGNIDDFTAKIVANSIVTSEVTIPVNSSDGSWSFSFAPQEGANTVLFTASDESGNINQLSLMVTHDTTPPVVAAVTQTVDPSPQLLVTFNEALLDSSLTTATFAVVTDGISLNLTADPLNPLTPRIVTLPLSAALTAGPHQLSCSGISDLSTLTGNSVAVGYSFDFTIQ